MKTPFITRKYSLLLGVVALLLIAGSFGLKVNQGEAFVGGGGTFGGGGASGSFGGVSPVQFFGGQITSVFYCPCSANLAIVVGPPSPGVFMYQPGVSMVYAWYQIFRPGPWVLGTYTPGGACMMFIPYGCAPMAAPMGTISHVGTSL